MVEVCTPTSVRHTVTAAEHAIDAVDANFIIILLLLQYLNVCGALTTQPGCTQVASGASGTSIVTSAPTLFRISCNVSAHSISSMIKFLFASLPTSGEPEGTGLCHRRVEW